MVFLSVPMVIGAAVVFFVVRYLSAFYTSYKLAKSIGVPVLIAPVSDHTPAWKATQEFLIPWINMLPGSLGRWPRYTRSAWNYYDKSKLHEEVGDIFVVCSPGFLDLRIADAAVSDHVLSKRKEFLKPIGILGMSSIEVPCQFSTNTATGELTVFGESVASVEHEDWQRHRRITAPPFNERNSALVWQESSRQTVQMLEVWSETQDKFRSVVGSDTDFATLALNVLTMAGFGVEHHFRTELNKPGNGHSITYHQALAAVMRNILLALVIPKWVFGLPVLPKSLAEYGSSTREFQEYLGSMLSDAKVRLRSGDEMPANLLSTLVQKSEEVKHEENNKGQGGKKNGLDDDEITGNLFIFSFAGHETTAKTLSYTL